MGLLDGKVGYVTGAAQGLGRAVALLAAREGSRVAVADIQQDATQKVADEIENAGGEALFVPTDVADELQVAHSIGRCVERFGRLDWACNNAVGGAAGFSPLDQLDDRSFASTIDVCLKGVFYGMKHQIPAMLQHGGGSVINVTTAAVFKGEAMLSAYSAAKGGVHTLTLTGAAEYSGRGVRVNSVAPGAMATPALTRYFERYPDFEQKTLSTNAMRRVGRPEEVAEPIVWLASDRASFVTGTCFAADGGVTVNSHLL